MKPKDNNKSNEQDILKSVYSHLKIVGSQKFKVGDIVRISKAKHVFQKGYTRRYARAPYKWGFLRSRTTTN